MDDKHFAALYKTLPTDRLLDIIASPDQYQQAAVEAARVELNSRKLTVEQLDSARDTQTLRLQRNAVKQAQENFIGDKVKVIGSSLFDFLNPLQKESPGADRLIKAISIFLGGIFLYRIFTGFGLLISVLQDPDDWDFSVVLYLAPFFVLPTAGILFWNRNKAGWILATFYFFYQAAGAMQLFFLELSHRSTILDPVLDVLFPRTPPVVYFGTLVLHGALAWTLCKENIRVVYKADKRTMLTVIVIAIALVAMTVLLY